ncbi:bacteriophage Gp15 family protein [Clostridium sp.]|uniref:bacteriophage Gp15 family protein n=1 Tax=Clostridium sp. TaxID=1506 RepID=UPI00290CBF59|nr:bacteriophage Gp15 family protein [Clostridium sp.]MDU7363039.1 bacteriophage Gp15 family protein [Clostridium sp.]
MNILVDLLPIAVEIDNKNYEINSDFRTSILFELLMQDDSIGEEDKILMALQLYYPVIPESINEAIEQILWFYRCGKEITSSKGNGKGKRVTQIYSFEHDDDYIYAAFMDQYNIDLQDIEYLHWWKFKAMFNSLKEDIKIVKIMEYRSMDLSKIKDKEQKAYYKRMKDLYEIPISKDEDRKLKEIEEALLNGKDINKIL